MIEALNQHGELHRPSKERQRGTCYACGGVVVSLRIPHTKHFAWQHKDTPACLGPNDGWRERVRAGFVGSDFTPATEGDHFLGDAGAVVFADGPQPRHASLLDAFEFDTKARHGWLTWVVDGRYASLAFGLNYPGHEHPSWLAGTEWSPFVQAWLAGRQGVTIAIELGYCLPRQEKPVFFVARKPWTYSVRRRGGNLAGLVVTGADGYLVTFAQLAQHGRQGRGPHTVDTHSLDRYRYSGQGIQRVYR